MRRPTDRGATLVEYALIIALFVTVSVGAVEMLTHNASDEYAASGERIGSPNPTLPPDWVPPPDSDPIPVDPVDPGGPDPSDPDPSDPDPSDPDPSDPDPATISSASCRDHDCSFAVEAGPGSTFAWSTSNGLSGNGSSFAGRFDPPGIIFSSKTYTVSVLVNPGAQTIERTVTCSRLLWSTSCDVGGN